MVIIALKTGFSLGEIKSLPIEEALKYWKSICEILRRERGVGR